MQTLGFALLALGILGFGLVSGKAQKSILTPPMAFVAFGCLLSEHGLGLIEFHVEEGLIHLLAEVTLILVLFTDASQIDLKRLRREHDLPVRMLALGLPLCIAAGTLVGALLLTELSIWEAALLAALLAPTDAALGQAVVTSEKVPARIRQTLNVESGLNDGIALPVVLIFLSIACAMAESASVAYWLGFSLKQVTLGPLVGIVVGWAGAKLVEWASRTGWMNPTFRDLASIGLALLAFAGAELIGGNGFIAAFAAGLALGNTARDAHSLERFAEAEGQLLVLMVFLVFGGVMLPEALHHLNGTTLLYAILSLTVVRILPVAVSLLGKGQRWETVLFLGWFGPRGIASILFALLVIEAAPVEHEGLVPVVMLTVLLSVVLHGITANPAAAWYARRLARDGATESV